MSQPALGIRLDSESDEYQTTTIIAVPPTWRDTWKILRGTYKPQVVKRKTLTSRGMARILKQTWNTETMREQMHSSPLFESAAPE